MNVTEARVAEQQPDDKGQRGHSPRGYKFYPPGRGPSAPVPLEYRTGADPPHLSGFSRVPVPAQFFIGAGSYWLVLGGTMVNLNHPFLDATLSLFACVVFVIVSLSLCRVLSREWGWRGLIPGVLVGLGDVVPRESLHPLRPRFQILTPFAAPDTSSGRIDVTPVVAAPSTRLAPGGYGSSRVNSITPSGLPVVRTAGRDVGGRLGVDQ